jgi:hypothetical protein
MPQGTTLQEENLHRPNSAMLPTDPALGKGVVVVIRREREAVLRIVAPGQVAEDGVPLEHGQITIVVVDEDGNAAVGVLRREPRLLLDILADVDPLPCVLQAVGLL